MMVICAGVDPDATVPDEMELFVPAAVPTAAATAPLLGRFAAGGGAAAAAAGCRFAPRPVLVSTATTAEFVFVLACVESGGVSNTTRDDDVMDDGSGIEPAPPLPPEGVLVCELAA